LLLFSLPPEAITVTKPMVAPDGTVILLLKTGLSLRMVRPASGSMSEIEIYRQLCSSFPAVYWRSRRSGSSPESVPGLSFVLLLRNAVIVLEAYVIGKRDLVLSAVALVATFGFLTGPVPAMAADKFKVLHWSCTTIDSVSWTLRGLHVSFESVV